MAVSDVSSQHAEAQAAPIPHADNSSSIPSLQPSAAGVSSGLWNMVIASSGTVLALAALVALLAPVEPASADALHSTAAGVPASVPMFDLAEGEEFWGNVAKYGRYFVTVMLGTGYVMVQPLVAAFKRPVTAIVAIVGIGGGAVLLKFTLDAMLGIQEPFAYEPGNIVPYN
jgi:hypothetical protein